MSTEFQLGMMKVLEIDGGDDCTTLGRCFNAKELYP